MGERLRFTIEPERSTVAIEARSSVHPINGETNGVEGTVELAVAGDTPDLSTPPAAHIELPIDRLSSGNRLYDNEMQRRVDARKFPTIIGELELAEAADGDGRYHVSGTLRFHGQRRTVDADIIAKVTGTRLVADWEQTIDIRDFGVEPPKILMLRVYPDVKVVVHIEAEADQRPDDS